MNYPQLYTVSKSSIYHEWSFLFLIALTGATFGYALSCVMGGPTSDEGFHAPQVWHYYVGGKTYADNLTVPPTYHFILAFIVRQIGHYSDYILRLINLSIALFSLPLFYAIAARYYPRDAGIRMLQLFFAPLIFPYFFLIYTDTWALLAITLTIFLALRRWYMTAALAGLFAICLRQDSVIWVGLAYLLICFDGVTLKMPSRNQVFLKNACIRGLPFLIIFALFIAFIIYNGGVAIGDKAAHEMGKYNVSNLYVFLVCAWMLFLPLNLQQIPQILVVLRKPWVMIALLVGFLVYMGTLSNPHGYNNTLFSYFLHNGLIYIMMKSAIGKVFFYIPIAWMALTLCTIKFPEKRYYWLLLIIPISAISHPLIEPRYYFPAYMLINLWRPQMRASAEILTLAIYIAVATFVMFGTVRGIFFL
jgi:alpha-1,2-glucosyltransferase